MKFLLKLVGIVLAAIVLLWLISQVSVLSKNSKLKSQGFSKEEIELFSKIEYQQKSVNSAVGKSTKFISWGHLTELYDDDGTTLVGYYIDGMTEGAAIGKRYFFTKDKELLWWCNQTDDADAEGRQHLKEGKGW